MAAIVEYLHEIKKEKLRMFLTIMGICWGMANIVLMLSVGEGLYRQFQKDFQSFTSGFIVFWGGSTSKPFSGFGIGRHIRMTEEDIPMIINRVQEIVSISPDNFRNDNKIKLGRNTLTVPVHGVYPSYGEMRVFFPETGGRFINQIDQDKMRRVIFIGNGVRDDLFGKDVNPVGQTVLFNNIPFKVVGVLKKKLGVGNERGNDADQTLIPASTFRVMFNRPRIDAILFIPRSPGESKVAIDQVRRILALKYKFDAQDKQAINFFDAIEMAGTFMKVIRGIHLFLGIVGGMTLLIAGLGLANIMYVTVKDRTREIGIKMAVGARPGYIVGQFVFEALTTTAIGGVLGIVLGLTLLEGFKMLPIDNEAMKYIGKPVFSGLLALICTTILTFIGLLSGVFPANHASHIDPVDALRYE